jgi:lipid A 3-O-deacylase
MVMSGNVLMGKLLCLVVAASCVAYTNARAADLPDRSALPVTPAVSEPQLVSESQLVGFEARLGAFAHGVGSIEKETVTVSVDFVTPRLLAARNAWWDALVPRAYVGGMINLQGRTSSIHAGARWLFPITDRVFAEGFFGGAVHDGSINGDPTHAALGSRVLFHVGGALGYRFDRNWSGMLMFDHLSNGNRVFGTGFVRNEGINSYGMKFGYAF